ncbi:MAG: outer membrane beta-barrel family protein [Tannerellaceae bacterium]|nr:outer membrane beta-barrel family protein [Tannerellaceae bacterium]
MPVDDYYTKLINANYGNSHSVSFAFIWNNSFFNNRVMLNTSVEGTYMESKGKVESIIVDVAGFYYNMALASNILLSQRYNWMLNTTVAYRSKTKLAHEIGNDMFIWGMGVRKVFSGNISLNFGVEPLVFRFGDVYKNNENYTYNIRTIPNIRSFYLGLSIPFGNQKTHGAQGRNTSSSKAKSRLKE